MASMSHWNKRPSKLMTSVGKRKDLGKFNHHKANELFRPHVSDAGEHQVKMCWPLRPFDFYNSRSFLHSQSCRDPELSQLLGHEVLSAATNSNSGFAALTHNLSSHLRIRWLQTDWSQEKWNLSHFSTYLVVLWPLTVGWGIFRCTMST